LFSTGESVENKHCICGKPVDKHGNDVGKRGLHMENLWKMIRKQNKTSIHKALQIVSRKSTKNP